MRLIKYAAIVLSIATLVYFGFYQSVTGAQNILIFWVWLLLLWAALIQTDAVVRGTAEKVKNGEELPAVPKWLDRCVDTLIAASLVWVGAWWTAAAYTGAALLLALFWERVEDEAEPHGRDH